MQSNLQKAFSEAFQEMLCEVDSLQRTAQESHAASLADITALQQSMDALAVGGAKITVDWEALEELDSGMKISSLPLLLCRSLSGVLPPPSSRM